jgi:hypothetical protein
VDAREGDLTTVETVEKPPWWRLSATLMTVSQVKILVER